MDETQSGSDAGTWAMSRLGYAIDAYVDRQLNNPQVIMDHSAGYGMDSNGALYRVGQPTVPSVAPVNGGSGMLLLILAIAFVASRHGK